MGEPIRIGDATIVPVIRLVVGVGAGSGGGEGTDPKRDSQGKGHGAGPSRTPRTPTAAHRSRCTTWNIPSSSS